MEFDSVAKIHEEICNQAAELANDMIELDLQIPRKWRGQVLEGVSQYTGSTGPDNGLSLRIKDGYALAPDRWKTRYRRYATAGLRQAIANSQELWVGMVIGEARAGRNYFNRWDQAPEALF